MTLNIRNPEADALARQLAVMDDCSITDAIVTALKETIKTRQRSISPLETARLVLEKHGIVLTEAMRKPVPQEAWG